MHGAASGAQISSAELTWAAVLATMQVEASTSGTLVTAHIDKRLIGNPVASTSSPRSQPTKKPAVRDETAQWVSDTDASFAIAA